MNQKLQEKWDEAFATGKAVKIGDLVVCDYCDQDYTGKKDAGGFIFVGKACCPACASEKEVQIEGYKETHLIEARANPGEPFADFVIRFRGPDSTVSIRVGG